MKTVQTIQNTINTSAHITQTIVKTPAHYNTHTYTSTHYKTSSNNCSPRYTTNEIITIQSNILSTSHPNVRGTFVPENFFLVSLIDAVSYFILNNECRVLVE
jgi:hypothetical protein